MTQFFRPSVCIDAVFEGKPTADALRTTREAGIEAFEFWGWWDRDLAELLALRDDLEMQIAACCTKFVSLVDPAARQDYIEGLTSSVKVAKQLNCRTLISQVGDFRPNVPREEQRQCLIDGLKEAASLLESSDITLVIEPLNDRIDHPGYFLVQSDEAFTVIDEVGSEHVKVVFDIYHQQISEGHVIERIRQNIDKIGHLHAAGNPGRHELTSGELHYKRILEAINQMPYQGFVGLEYWPTRDTVSELAEIASWFDCFE